MTLDHVVLWVDDPIASLDFYERVVGLPPVRAAEFRSGTAPFPSVRVSETAIIDLMARAAAPAVGQLTGAPASSGHPVSHLCLSMSEAEWNALRARLDVEKRATFGHLERSFGAQGLAPRAFYFHDLDGNVLEARYY